MEPIPATPNPLADFAAALDAARRGAPAALGHLLEACRNYLLLVANQELDPGLQAKFGPSDLVQDTLLEAQRDFGRFHGRSAEEWRAWLRQILRNNLANAARQFRATAMRDVGREIALSEAAREEHVEALVCSGSSPSSVVAADEEARRLRAAVERLPPDYREVVRLRHEEGLSYEEIGRRLGRSDEAVRKLWTRAIVLLKELLKGSSNDPTA
jgi:RNA polymerase sigma-70 factor (ECF subfamily)